MPKPSSAKLARSARALACGILLLSPASSRAEDARQPEQLVREAIDSVLQVLRDPQLQQAAKREERYTKLREIAATVFDWEEMARRSLGPYWREISSSQRQRFLKLFKNTLADYYLDHLDKFGGREQVKIEGAEREGDEATVKSSVLTESRERVPMNYFMHLQDGRWWIYDVSIEGVSLASHYRRRFQQFLVNHTFDQLLTRLARPT